DGMQLIPSHAPPTRQNRTGDQTRNQILPDEGLNIFRHDKILLHSRESIWQVGHGADQMSAAAGRPSTAKNARRAPNLVAGVGSFTGIIAAGEIMRADKERIIVNHLSAGRFVIGVIEAY